MLVCGILALRRPELALVALVAVTYGNVASVAADSYGFRFLNELLVPGLLLVLLVRYRFAGEVATALPRVAVGLAAYLATLAVTALYARDSALTLEGVAETAKDAVVALLSWPSSSISGAFRWRSGR